MTITHLKSAGPDAPAAAAEVADTVQIMLARLRAGGAQVALDYARQLDRWEDEITVSAARIAQAEAALPRALKDDIAWAHDNITRFAEAQRATARVAGVPDITAVSPPNGAAGIPDAMIHAMQLAGATRILTIGGVQAIAAMAFGLFGAPPADILVGPGNAYVAEAKRQLFGPVGIDMFAGPTDSLSRAERMEGHARSADIRLDKLAGPANLVANAKG